MKRAELRAWSEAKGVSLSVEAMDRLDRLIELWRRYGPAINLVGGIETASLWEHIREGLLGVALVERIGSAAERYHWVDVGSGGGLPGLVVAAVRPWTMTLIEPRERRAAFLDLGLASVAMGSSAVVRARWSDATWDKISVDSVELRSPTTFFILSSRAVFAAETWLARARSVGIPHGIVLCHVDSTTKSVGDERPNGILEDGRWAVMSFPVDHVIEGND